VKGRGDSATKVDIKVPEKEKKGLAYEENRVESL